MPTSRTILLAATLLLVTLSACTGHRGPPGGRGMGGPDPKGEAGGGLASGDIAARMMDAAHAREADGGCDAAIPTYRVMAGYGRGFEIAQYELATCLLETAHIAAGREALLDRREALIWLERAAWAGHAPAQRSLAETLAEDGDSVGALGWALVYNRENDRELTPMQDLSPAWMTNIRTGLDNEEVSEAETFASSWSKTTMAAFTMPEGLRNQGRSGMGGPGGGGRPPRR